MSHQLNRRLLVKAALSLFILYHMTVVLVLPNPSSIWSRKLSRFLTPYANQLSINTSWDFFSPTPAPTMYFEYQIDRGGDIHGLDSTTYYFPEFGSKGSYNPNANRLLYAMRFFILDPARVDRYFLPWLCRQHPQAEMIYLQHIIEPVENMERAGLDDTYTKMVTKNQVQSRQYNCREEHFE